MLFVRTWDDGMSPLIIFSSACVTCFHVLRIVSYLLSDVHNRVFSAWTFLRRDGAERSVCGRSRAAPCTEESVGFPARFRSHSPFPSLGWEQTSSCSAFVSRDTNSGCSEITGAQEFSVGNTTVFGSELMIVPTSERDAVYISLKNRVLVWIWMVTFFTDCIFSLCMGKFCPASKNMLLRFIGYCKTGVLIT